MRLKPVNDKIVVKPIEEKDENVTAGGLILPDTVQDGGLLEGKVMAVGDGMYSTTGDLIPMVVNKGNKILKLVKSNHLIKRFGTIFNFFIK